MGSKSTQTRFVGIITFTIHIHPYVCFSRLSCTYWCRLVVSVLDLHAGEIIPLWLRIAVSSLLHPIHIDTQKASVGMYSECDYPYKSCSCTFWPCHPYFILQFYSIVVSVLFFCCSQCNSSMPSYMVCSFNSQWSIMKFVCVCRIRSHAPHVLVPDKVAAMRLFDLGRKFKLCW